jgi:hypothetical protein
MGLAPTVTLSLSLVASIVAGEVGTTVPAARLPVACTVVEDVNRGRDLAQRWNGYQAPAPADVAAARTALEGGCDHLPYFRFLGSDEDLATWTRLGYVPPAADVWTWQNGGWLAIGIVEPRQRSNLPTFQPSKAGPRANAGVRLGGPQK